MKQKMTVILLTLCLCLSLIPGTRAAEPALEDSVNIEQLVAHAMQIYLVLEGDYDSVVPQDSNALSIGFLQWHGANALKLLQQICEAAPDFSAETLGAALYREILQTPLSGGWQNRVLGSGEADAIRTLIRSDVGITCQNQFARELIVEEAEHGWARGVRTEAALLYYCTIEHQYGVGGVSYFMQYVRDTMGITEDALIPSLDAFHSAVLEAADSHSSIRNYLSARKKVYRLIVDELHLSAGRDTAATPFADLPAPGHWARDAIEWAYTHDPQIACSSSDTSFSPDASVTRGEAVTFLWAAAGRPEPRGTTTPFEDVAGDKFYFTPVLWAWENQIVCGSSASSFSPEASVTRGEMLTLLWAAFGRCSPACQENPYSDLPMDQFYFTPVLWARDNGVLTGSEGGEDSALIYPTAPCTRAYVVTYLFRLFHKT